MKLAAFFSLTFLSIASVSLAQRPTVIGPIQLPAPGGEGSVPENRNPARVETIELTTAPNRCALRWTATPGQGYQVWFSRDMRSWRAAAAPITDVSGPAEIQIDLGGEDRLFFRLLEGGSSLVDAARFAQQATMGADYETIEDISEKGFSAWIDEQIALPPTFHVPRNNQLAVAVQEMGESFPYSDYIWTWWDVNLTGQDLLRQRVAFALSEIFVIGQTTDELEDYFWGIATFYDILVDEAFGNYRDLLNRVTTNPAMGHYLSHVKNRPADPVNNIFPDENYAREVMQLFSIGLYELNLDGTRKKNGANEDIPTYDNSNITEFARVFTGLTYNPQNPNNGTPYYGEPDQGPIASVEDYLEADDSWMGIEMAKYQPMHEGGVKQLLNGQSTNGNVQQDLDAAIDNLFHHPNVGPFIGRLLIQRLVKSNPSPEYVARVATAFNNNGSGVRGDMRSVIRAILLDPEARDPSFIADPTHGKLREPVIRHLHLLRAFNPSSSTGRFPYDHYEAAMAYAQRPMKSPSVFNFYLPDHQPLGVLKDNGLVAPEFQITTATTSIRTLNLWLGFIPWDELVIPNEDATGNPVFSVDYSDEIALAAAGNIDGLIDRLNILLTRGQLSPPARTIIRDALISARNTGEISNGEFVRFAVTLFASSPDFAVLR